MPIEADLKDVFFFFAEPIKTPSQQNTVKCKTHFADFLPQSCDIKTIQWLMP